MQTVMMQASRLVETARREPLGMSLTLRDDFDAAAGRAGELGEQVGERLLGAFHARRNDAGGDDAGLQQAEIVAGEIEDFGQSGDVGGGAEIDAGQAEHRFVDDAEIGFDRRLRRRRRGPRTARSTETLSTRAPSGKSMPRKKMSLQPLWVRSMRTGVRSRRIGKTPCDGQ